MKVILVADSPVLNPTFSKPFQNLSSEYGVYLNSLLISNWIENLDELEESTELIILLSEKDKEYIPKNFIPEKFKPVFYKGLSLSTIDENIFEQKTLKDSKTFFLFHNSIGLKNSDLERIFNLVQTEENSLVIAKSRRDKIVLTCFYEADELLVDSIFSSNRSYKDYLNLISSKDMFIHTLEGFLSIDDFEDIKKLYIELSKKESLSYCSQKMHESFNDLFVEYKELLNE